MKPWSPMSCLRTFEVIAPETMPLTSSVFSISTMSLCWLRATASVAAKASPRNAMSVPFHPKDSSLFHKPGTGCSLYGLMPRLFNSEYAASRFGAEMTSPSRRSF